MKIMKLKNYFVAAVLASVITAGAQPAKISVDAAQPGHKIPETLWGIFFEDINMSTDGGIYPELVRNRSFEDADKPENWKFASTGSGKSEAAISTAGKDINRLRISPRPKCSSNISI